ncbi:MAG: ribonuclease E/G, partial [Clostridia bacterium]|nr:ribonuclease E/G [Clostridia bacterium]
MAISIYVDGVGKNIVGAVADGKKLIEYRLEKKNKTVAIGSIFKGRVENVVSGMQACFVNVGLERNGYLKSGDMLMDRVELQGKVEFPSVLSVKEGEEIMVQAVKDPAGTKGVRLTSNISFAGRYVVYMPTIDFVGVSRKITDEAQRERLTKIAEEIRPKKQGLIIRTAGEDADKKTIKKELDFLARQYGEIESAFKKSPTPSILYEEGDVAMRLVRDVYNSDVEKFDVSDKATYAKLKDYAKTDMLKYFGLDEEVDKLLSNNVALESGAYLVIDKTEALTVIDVNTGKFIGQDNLEDTVFETNLLASKEIARQLRLRNLSGIIVVD